MTRVTGDQDLALCAPSMHNIPTMRHGESMPDIPHPQHPEQRDLQKAAEALVEKEVREMNVGLELDKHPEVRRRLAELGPHFKDSLAIAKIVGTTYPEMKKTLGLADEGPERMMRAALVHDVGKSGPEGDPGEFHFAVRQLFITPHRRFNPFVDGRAKTVDEFIAEQDIPKPDILKKALKDQGVDPSTEPMIHFWRRHAQWSHDLLSKETSNDIDDKVVKIAASHHILDGQNPAKLEVADIPAEAHVIELLEQCGLLAVADKYQAFRSRGGSSHEESIARVRKMVEAKTDIAPLLKEKFNAILDVFARSEAALAPIFNPKE